MKEGVRGCRTRQPLRWEGRHVPARRAVASPSLEGRLCKGSTAPTLQACLWEINFQGTTVSHSHTEPTHSEESGPPSRSPSPEDRDSPTG